MSLTLFARSSPFYCRLHLCVRHQSRRIALVASLSSCTVVLYCLLAAHAVLDPALEPLHRSVIDDVPLVDHRNAFDAGRRIDIADGDARGRTHAVWSSIDARDRRLDRGDVANVPTIVDERRSAVDDRNGRERRRRQWVETGQASSVAESGRRMQPRVSGRQRALQSADAVAAAGSDVDRYGHYSGRSPSVVSPTVSGETVDALREMKFRRQRSTSSSKTSRVKNKNENTTTRTTTRRRRLVPASGATVDGDNGLVPWPAIEVKPSPTRYDEGASVLASVSVRPVRRMNVNGVDDASVPNGVLMLAATNGLPIPRGRHRTTDAASVLDVAPDLPHREFYSRTPDGVRRTPLQRLRPKESGNAEYEQFTRHPTMAVPVTAALNVSTTTAWRQHWFGDVVGSLARSPLSGPVGDDVSGYDNRRNVGKKSHVVELASRDVSDCGDSPHKPRRKCAQSAASVPPTTTDDGVDSTPLQQPENVATGIPDLMDFLSSDERSSSREIPEILHQTWDNVFIPRQVLNWVRSWSRHNPNFDLWFWTDSGARRLLQQSSLSSNMSSFAADLADVADLYDSYPHAIHRADVRKYLALFSVGGIIADLDTESLRPLDLRRLVAAASGRSCVLAREPELHRAFVYHRADPLVTAFFAACRPRHPFFRFVLVDLLPVYAENAHRLLWNDNVLNSTGPEFLTDAVRLYRDRKRPVRPEDDVFIAPADWFAPTVDPLHADRFRLMCKLSILSSVSGKRPDDQCDRIQRRLTDVITTSTVDAPYTTHHWLHSWSDQFLARGGLVNVTAVHRVDVLVT